MNVTAIQPINGGQMINTSFEFSNISWKGILLPDMAPRETREFLITMMTHDPGGFVHPAFILRNSTFFIAFDPHSRLSEDVLI